MQVIFLITYSAEKLAKRRTGELASYDLGNPDLVSMAPEPRLVLLLGLYRPGIEGEDGAPRAFATFN